MKLALCLSGLVCCIKKFGKGSPIDYRLPYQHFKKNISDNQIELDVFMHSWSVDYQSELIECYKPKDYISGTKMNFARLKNVEDRANLIAWFRQLSDNPVPLPE